MFAGFPAVGLCAFLLWYDGYSAQVQWTIDLLLVLLWLGIAFNLKSRIVRPLQTLSNILAAIREGDYSIRGRRALTGDALGEVMLEVNDLGQTLREQRLGAMEATALLRTVMAEIDVAVFAFDGEQRLQLVNRSGERLLAQPSARLLGRTAEELGLPACLNSSGSTPQTMQMVFPGGVGRWDIRRSTFREGGAQHQLLVLTDLSSALREEERTAWQRLLRVLGHELNNSLAPIKSVAGSLADLMGREPEPPDWREDMQRGLAVISSRADSLARFVESYSKLARLPPPRLEPLKIGALVSRVASLETRLPVNVVSGPDVVVRGDDAARTVADQPRAECRRCIDGDARQGRCWLAAEERAGRGLGARRGAGTRQHREPLRAVFYDEGAGIGNRPRAVATDCRSARRYVDARESSTASGL